jgi:hypothetical protein
MNDTSPDDSNTLFYTELYKLLDYDSDNESDTNKCLISCETLVDKFVKLPCNHSFNYIPLYNDIKNHKTKFNHMETSSGKLLTHEIRCPYCRNIHAELLPYYEEMGLAKIHGVNCVEPTPHNNVPADKACSYVDADNSTACSCYAIKVNVTDKKLYCYYHNMIVNSAYRAQIKANKKLVLEAKQKIKDEKQKIKDEKQKIKDEKQKIKNVNQKLKEEKQKVKEDKKLVLEAKQNAKTPVIEAKKAIEYIDLTNEDTQNTIENLITIKEEPVITPPCGCIATLKTGPRKGQVCNKRTFQSEMCKLHYCIFLK